MRKSRDMLVVGLALFAMFFGAGNLIFPPYLGMTAGPEWFTGFLCFIIADIGLAFATIVAMMQGDGSMAGVTGPVGRLSALVLNTAIVVCIGPLFATPRTAATTFEMFVMPIFPAVESAWVFSLLYFAIVALLAIRPTKVVDIIGKVLTPVMVAGLLVLIIAGIFSPVGPVREAAMLESVAKEGIVAGYQTMDVFGALVFAMIVISAVEHKGYCTPKARMAACAKSCLVAGVGLFVVYCGLSYLGATASTLFAADVDRTVLLVSITKLLLGNFGVVLLGSIVALACLTTAVGLTSSCAHYFEKLAHGRVPYGLLVAVISAVCLLVSNLGLTTIIRFAAPVLSLLYPAVLTLVFLSYFKKRLRNTNIHRFAVLFALVFSLFAVLSDLGLRLGFMDMLPLSDFGLEWVLPALLGGIIGSFIKPRGSAGTTRMLQ